MKNTPAPWHIAYYSTITPVGYTSHYSIKHGEKTICRTNNEVATQEDFANMRLCAVAPQLLDVVRKLAKVDNEEFLNTAWLENYNAVVVEAKEIIYAMTEMTKNVEED